MAITSQDLSILRSRPHSTKLFLSIFRPTVLLNAQINQPGVEKGETQIDIAILAGSSVGVLRGMTAYIGTTQGASDLGRLRVRAATATTITVAENSITWVDGWFLTVVRYFEPWGVFPRITLSGQVPTFYKDYDVLYTDQNQILDPVVCMGPNHAQFLDTVDNPYLVFDSFTGPNNTRLKDRAPDIAPPLISGSWQEFVGAWNIQNNEAWPTGSLAGPTQHLAVIESNQSDVYVESNVSMTGSAMTGLAVRVSNRANALLLIAKNSGDRMELFRYQNFGFTSLGSAPAEQVFGGDTIGVRAVGDAITAYHNGSPVISATSAFNQAQTRHGLTAQGDLSPRSTFDNFSIVRAPPIAGANVWYSSSGTFDPTPGGSIAGYDWAFEGGLPTGSTAADPGYVNYTGCGQFVTSLEVTTADGAVFTGYRHISILTKPGEAGLCKPISAWGLEGLSGDRDSGGWEASVWLRSPYSINDVPDGALAVIFTTDDRHGYVDGAIGSNAEGRETILFSGYVDGESIQLDPENDRLNFSIRGLGSKMSELSTFSWALDDKETAESWTDMRQMTVDRGIIHFLRWNSTVLAVADFSPTGDTKPVEYLDFSRGSVYETVDQLLESTLLAGMVVDRQGKMWTEIEASAQPTGTRSFETALEMSSEDWRDQLSIRRDTMAKYAFIELGGIAYSGPTTGTFNAYLAGAPGEAPDYYGKAQRSSGLVIASQPGLNELTGNVWANANADFPDVSVPLAGDYRFLDIAPQRRVLVNLEAARNWRGVEMVDRPFVPEEMSIEYRAEDAVLLMDMSIREETHGDPADTITIPVDPPYDAPYLPSLEISFPPLLPPAPLPLPSDTGNPVSTGGLVYICAPSALVRSRNFGPTGTTTFTDITPAPTMVTGSFTNFHLDAVDPKNTAYLITSTGNGGPPNGSHLYKTSNLDAAAPTWTALLTPDGFRALYSGLAANSRSRMYAFGQSRMNPTILFLLGQIHTDVPNGNQDQTRIARSTNGGASWAGLTDAAMDKVGGSASSQHNISPSDHSLGKVFALRDTSSGGGIDGQLLYSGSLGNAWQLKRGLAATPVLNFHVPFQGNAGDQIVFWSEGAGSAKRLYVSTDALTSVITEITPAAQGSNWAVRLTGVLDDMHQAILSHDSNALFMAAILARQQVTDGNDSLFFYSLDGGSNWIPTTLFTGTVTCLAWNKRNVGQLYMINRDDVVGRSAIYFSNDGGSTWVNLFAAWMTLFGGTGRWGGGGGSDKGTAFTVVPVWTE